MLCEKHDKLSILSKEGANGATLITKDRDQGIVSFNEIPEDDLKIINTTGAGDTFTAAFAVKENLRFASAAAFLCICRDGAASSIPLKHEVEQFLKDRGET